MPKYKIKDCKDIFNNKSLKLLVDILLLKNKPVSAVDIFKETGRCRTQTYHNLCVLSDLGFVKRDKSKFTILKNSISNEALKRKIIIEKEIESKYGKDLKKLEVYL